MKKHFSILVLLMLVLCAMPVCAEKEKETIIRSDKYGNIVSGGTIQLNGEERDLCVVFENPEEALHNFVQKYQRVFDRIQKQFNMDFPSKKNMKEYRERILEYYWSEEYRNGKEYDPYAEANFNIFYDIYDNNAYNAWLLELYEQKEYEALELNLPYSYEREKETQDFNDLQSVSSFSVGPAISYALAYAESPNTANYPYWSGSDCANFCSQIMEAGGTSQNNTGNRNSGWWLNSTFTNWSYSWSMANSFSNYFGMAMSTTSLSALTSNVRGGSFITIDYDNDGVWEHVGFVTYKGVYNSSLGYYNSTIAQHSNNYIAQFSSSTNGWDDYDGVGRYGLIQY